MRRQPESRPETSHHHLKRRGEDPPGTFLKAANDPDRVDVGRRPISHRQRVPAQLFQSRRVRSRATTLLQRYNAIVKQCEPESFPPRERDLLIAFSFSSTGAHFSCARARCTKPSSMRPSAKRSWLAINSRSMKRPIAIDLFAGCGGLFAGLKAAGFVVKAAVESNKAVTPTYRADHRGTKLLDRDICTVTAADLRAPCRGRQVTLLAGCAPCQGFCSLTAKHRRQDPRNKLVLRMASLIKEIKPEAVMVENVPGLEVRGAPIFHEFLQTLRAVGYKPTWRTVQMADYGVPHLRRRRVLLAGRGFEIPFPDTTHRKESPPGFQAQEMAHPCATPSVA